VADAVRFRTVPAEQPPSRPCALPTRWNRPPLLHCPPRTWLRVT